MPEEKHSARKRPTKKYHFALLLYLFASLAVPELVLHCATAGSAENTFNSGLFLAPAFCAVTALLLMALIQLISVKWFGKAVTLISALLAVVLCASQLVYFRIFGCFYSAYSMANGAEALQFWNTLLTQLLHASPLILLMAAPLLFYLIWGRKLLRFHFPRSWYRGLIPAAGALLLHIALVLSLPLLGGTGALSAHELYHFNSDSFYSINRLGFTSAFRLDVQRLITGKETGGSIQLEDPIPTSPPETEPQPTDAPAPLPDDTVPISTEPTEPPINTSPNVLSIDFDLLAETTADQNIQQLHRYFARRTPTNRNEKTGMFEGCNLILITAEAWSYLMVDEERTPTMYKLMHEGFYFSDFYVPDWGTSTTDGEYAFLTGTIPKSNCWSFFESADNSMPLTMSRQLIERGYSAYAYHGHTYDYYNRDQYLENLGYTYRAYGYGLPVEKTWPESDLEVVDLSTGDFVSNEPFTAYYMTISGHREFNFYGNMMAYKNQALVKDEPYSTAVQAYFACQLELEHALTLLLERLEEAGTLDNTVIVMVADHYPNGLTNEEYSELLGHEVETNFELYKNGCIIYKPGMEGDVIDTPCSHLDLLPTLSNLFGLDFDSRLYMGRDVFSDSDSLVIFRNRSWITDLAFYNAVTGEVIPRTDAEVTEEYVQRICTEVSNRFSVSSRILDTDYWAILFG